MPDLVGCILPAVFLIVMAVFGYLTLVAKEKWRDKPKTQLFAAIACIATIGLIMWALIYK